MGRNLLTQKHVHSSIPSAQANITGASAKPECAKCISNVMQAAQEVNLTQWYTEGSCIRQN